MSEPVFHPPTHPFIPLPPPLQLSIHNPSVIGQRIQLRYLCVELLVSPGTQTNEHIETPQGFVSFNGSESSCCGNHGGV